MIGYITGLRALLTAQVGMQTAGNNTANAATPGYSRQRVLLRSTPSLEVHPRLFVGTGVEAASINSITDSLLDSRIRTQERALGRFDMLSLAYSEIESRFQEPSEAGLSTRLSSFFSALTPLTTSPQDNQLRSALANEGTTVSERFHLLSSQVSSFADDIASQISGKVLEVNRLAETISQLNAQIIQETARGAGANEIKDERTRLLKDLNRLVDAQVVDQSDGSATVLVAGQLLVSRDNANELEFTRVNSSEFRLAFADTNREVELADGEIAGLLEISSDVLPDVLGRLDSLAANLIFEFNRIHSTGIPSSGAFTSLSSTYAVQATNGNPGSIPLAEAGLPFPPDAGTLRFSVTDEATGEVQQTSIDIDPATDTLSTLVDKINAIPNLEASFDGQGILNLRSETGYTFDFSNRLDPNPDDAGTFAGTRATISGSLDGPFALTNGDQIDLVIDGGPAQTITFNTGDFADISAATAQEVAAAIQAQVTGATASVVDGRVVLQSDTDGSAGSIQAADVTGTPLAALGLPATADTGSDAGLEVTASGTYTHDATQNFRFVANDNGEIGVTTGLTIDVLDENGTVLRTLDVGPDYVPGTPLDVADGIQIAFGNGEISADANDTFVIHAVADTDTGDFLPALGLNSFFDGSNAADIAVVDRIQANADLLAGSLSGASGDNSNFLRFLELQDTKLDSLANDSIEGFYSGLVADVGSDGLRSLNFFESQTVLTDFLEQQRDSVSGVSIDEETVNLLQFQRQFEAASRYISIVDATMQEVLSLVR